MQAGRTILATGALACVAAVMPVTAQEQAGPVWPKLNASERTEVTRFGDDFKQFIGKAKSEAVVRARGDATRRGRRLPGVAFHAREGRRGAGFEVVCRQSRTQHRRICRRSRPGRQRHAYRQLAQRFAAPRAEAEPFRDSFEISMLDTRTHGTLKNYQWVNRPLALIGRVTRMDGTSVESTSATIPRTRC